MASGRKLKRCEKPSVIYILCLVLLSVNIYMYNRRLNNSSVPFDCLRKVPSETIATSSPHDKFPRPYENITARTGRILFYPRGGTGESVDVSKDFDLDIFNSFCETGEKVKAVLPIYCSVDKFKMRSLLRDSLGRLARKMNCRIFFIVGMSKNASVIQKLREEYRTKKDILIVGKIDTYRDLNNKAAAMVEWVSKYCTNIPYVIHMIDDAYIDLQRWLERLESIKLNDYILGTWTNTTLWLVRLESIKLNDYILGTWTNTPTVRNHKLWKSYVTVEEYPYPRFPIYAYGFAFAFPSRTAARLQSALYNATYCWIEDVWIAGHVRETANVTLVPIKNSEYGQGPRIKFTPAKAKQLIMYHPVSGEDLQVVYLSQGGF